MSIAVICVTAVLGELSLFLPWSAVFALQKSLSSDERAATPIELAFNPRSGAYRGAAGGIPPDLQLRVRGFANTGGPDYAALLLPLRATGLGPGDVLFLDRADIRISGPDGRPLYEGRTSLSVDGGASIADAQLSMGQPESSTAPVDSYERIFIPSAQFAHFGDRRVTLVVRYSLSLLRPATILEVPALGGDALLPGVGWCATRADNDGDAVEVGCIDPASLPSCMAAYLEENSGRHRNPEVRHCDPDYAPMAKDDWYLALDHFHMELPFFDRSGLTHYPVDGSMLTQARIVIRNYRAVAHFSRRLTMNGIVLRDWRVQ